MREKDMAASSPAAYASSSSIPANVARAKSLNPARRFSAIDGGRKDPPQGSGGVRFPFGAAAGVIQPAIEIYPPRIATRRTMVWHGMAAETVECTGAEAVTYRFRAPLHLLVAYEQMEQGGETFVEGLPPSRLRGGTRKLTVVPAGHEYRERHDSGTPSRMTFFYFDPSWLTHHSGPKGENSLAPRLCFEDQLLWHTAAKLTALLGDASPGDRLYLKALGVVLMRDLVRSNCKASAAQGCLRGGLAGWQQRIVTAHIEKCFAEPIPLTSLAKLVRLSTHHFCRAFTQSFGMPPHRYQNEHRMKHAKLMLEQPGVSITDIALEVGFGSSSSFATAFRKATGQTPTAYSRSLGALQHSP
jgi:AraC family transcriptional regulator